MGVDAKPRLSVDREAAELKAWRLFFYFREEVIGGPRVYLLSKENTN